MRLDDLLRREPRFDLTLVAGPWDVRTVERVSVLDDPAGVAEAGRGELALLTRRASRSAAGRGLTELLEVAGRRELVALGLYGRATTSQAVIGAASHARVALLSVGVGEDPAALAFGLEAALRADADAVLRRLSAAAAAIEHAEPDGVEAILVAASAALEAELTHRQGTVEADREDTAVRIACRLVADAIRRGLANPEPVPVEGGSVILIEPEERERSDLVLLEALRLARETGWRATRDETAVALAGDCPAADIAGRLIARLEMPVLCGVGSGVAEARAALARARAAGVLNVPFPFDAADPGGLVGELAGSPTARAAAAGLLAPLERLGEGKAETAIGTLQVYLDNWGSLARSGEALHLHPNAVGHRMKRIRALLPVDLDDPGQRLALQIACRARG
jgi:hypothetical protein